MAFYWTSCVRSGLYQCVPLVFFGVAVVIMLIYASLAYHLTGDCISRPHYSHSLCMPWLYLLLASDQVSSCSAQLLSCVALVCPLFEYSVSFCHPSVLALLSMQCVRIAWYSVVVLSIDWSPTYVMVCQFCYAMICNAVLHYLCFLQ